ncbi:YjcG family protein [Mangrovibacillus cuniculi]|uniref:Putative phosphoesterase G8O30_03585 n=1 Tax=Mangrovibacillus cuniculi TaxID=2593652 RepID=A0A7S8C9X9_9BACI|nr:YjcG family protein [Mangrovibacillus cuniculi]QPC46105.1 hypothetical protein G8O30_03585 [Mangrovibacillus cuniculi]
MKYGIVMFPSKQLQDKANAFRKRYDPHYALISPHITLKGAFEATDAQLNEYNEKLREIAKTTAPLKLTIQKVSSFQPVNNVIYFKVAPTEELSTLHQTMYENIGQEQPDYSFVPHITIGQKLSDDEHSDVYGSLRMEDVSYEETIDRFHLLYQLDNGSWTVYETFRLEGKDL